MNKFIFLSLICLSIGGAPAWAVAPEETIPLPTTKYSKKELKRQIEDHQKQSQEIGVKASSLQKDIASQQKHLVAIGKDIQKTQNRLYGLNQTIDARTKDVETLKEQLNTDRRHMVDLALTLDRLKAIPIAAIVAQPGSPYHTAQSALIIDSTTRSILTHSENIRKNTARLELQLDQLNADKREAITLLSSVQASQKNLNTHLKEKETLYKRYRRDIAQAEAKAEALAKESKSLQDFIGRLKEEQTQQQTSWFSPPAKKSPIFSGNSVMPVAGHISVAYGQQDFLQAKSQGIWIETPPSALVVSPLAGRIKFIGPFKNYGNIIIIEHADGFHSIIGGLEKIRTKISHDIEAGEALGYLGKDSRFKDTPLLYFELRHHGKAVDPTRTLKRLI